MHGPNGPAVYAAEASGDAVGVIIMAKEASWNFLESLCLCGGIVSHTKRQDRSDPDEFSSKPQAPCIIMACSGLDAEGLQDFSFGFKSVLRQFE